MEHPESHIPKWAEGFLSWYCRPELLEEIQGDLYELFDKRAKKKSVRFARRRFIWDVFRSLRLSTIRFFSLNHLPAMYKSYFKLALRNFWKEKLQSSIHIFGLTLGLTFGLLMLLWVQDEVEIDKFHEDSSRVYQVFYQNQQIETPFLSHSVSYPTGTRLQEEVPGVEAAALMEHEDDFSVEVGDKIFKERGRWGHFDVFKIFSFPILEGSLETSEADLASVIISDELAEKYFGKLWQGNAVGKTVGMQEETFVIKAVFEKIPEQSSIQFDLLANMEFRVNQHSWIDHWGNRMFRGYVKTKALTSTSQAEDQITQIYRKENPDDRNGATTEIQFLPFKDRYLWGRYENGEIVGGRIEYVRIFLLVGIFLILIACINFINLSTARASSRAREVGVRKTIGAKKNHLVSQFLVETSLYTLGATCLSILLSYLLLPEVNTITGKEISIPLQSPLFWGGVGMMVLMLTFLAGLYPAYILSGFKPALAVKGGFRAQKKGKVLRSGLVVTQFVLSGLLIISTLTVKKQLDYIQFANLGLDRDNMVYMDMSGPMYERYDALKTNLLQYPEIAHVLQTSHAPINIRLSTGDYTWPGKGPDEFHSITMFWTEVEFAEAFDVAIEEGRFFQADIPSDSQAVVINEAAAEVMGLENPIGTMISRNEGDNRPIIGVMKNFHMQSLHETIKPMVIELNEGNKWSLFVHLEKGKTKEGLATLEKVWGEVIPDYPLDYEFLDQTYGEMYKSELTVGKLSYYFTAIAILISCLGLLGLSTFIARQKTKEIGIRKILGASMLDIVRFLSRDFVLLVMVAILIASPIAWYALENWLGKFTYKVEIDMWIFAYALIISLLVSILTMSVQSVRAASQDPVKALRYE
ncbi:MAG: FtsX-like permease family protein [Bacteroidota bacterium]